MDIQQQIIGAISNPNSPKIAEANQAQILTAISDAIDDVRALRGQNLNNNEATGTTASVTFRFMNTALRQMHVDEIDIALTQGCLRNTSEFPSPAVYIKWLKEYLASDLRAKAVAEYDKQLKETEGKEFDEVGYVKYICDCFEGYKENGRRCVAATADAFILDYLISKGKVQAHSIPTYAAMSKNYVPDPTSSIFPSKLLSRIKQTATDEAKNAYTIAKGKSVALYNYFDMLIGDNIKIAEVISI